MADSMPLPKPEVAPVAPTSSSGVAIKGKEVVTKYIDAVNSTDIHRINGYLRVANIFSGVVFGIMGIFDLFSIDSYKSFLVAVYVIVLSSLLVLFEFREKFPKLEAKTKENFGFMFTGFGRSVYIMIIAFLSFSQGTLGIVMGVGFLLLSAFNFFIMWNHPGYHQVMRAPNNTTYEKTAEASSTATEVYVPTAASIAV
ncbi:hypothetical protein SPRG_08831 [Saprolegnia parasitica CBS 223.65]|uniref:Golgi apparatus membrane protein TVP15 n=1 Tax=Saprolegnia parasitica (strain CBS 223.65) TaxID=695850 RepID=A0A067C531_SAPPC|nr:hypothetical protein SPRG_08831 [Saprolegnia parasitica CBS 223.65]KDO25889.1 hypothetical protein SPRG_08831 [Saprolegnia parasitica CBS 223.65]|eukprot:XP_012203450.1 hypothetical protein SPRG_08831 [Saprolegnia parasitica CBS 223.65]